MSYLPSNFNSHVICCVSFLMPANGITNTMNIACDLYMVLPYVLLYNINTLVCAGVEMNHLHLVQNPKLAVKK